MVVWLRHLPNTQEVATSILAGCIHQENLEFVSNCRGVIGGARWHDKAKTKSLQGALWPNG